MILGEFRLYDYQEQPVCGISYVLSWSSKTKFLLLHLDKYLFNVVIGGYITTQR